MVIYCVMSRCVYSSVSCGSFGRGVLNFHLTFFSFVQIACNKVELKFFYLERDLHLRTPVWNLVTTVQRSFTVIRLPLF